MKKIIVLFIAIVGMLTCSFGQATISNLFILPTNPTENDTIYIIYDISYQGNCQFGLVDTYISETDSSMHVMPLYCGYWDSTWCNRVDTIKIGPYPAGSYAINIEYHQGSVCPISNFDATIATFDTVLTIETNTSGLLEPSKNEAVINIFPNPSQDMVKISLENFATVANYRFKITDARGRKVLQKNISQNQFSIDCSAWTSGIYFLSIFDENNKFIDNQKFIIK